jgi:pimeloyl-ACP methyl ester carboxylesterase
LKKVRAPTLILHGIYDKLVPVEEGRELNRLIQSSKMVEFGAGHTFWNSREL